MGCCDEDKGQGDCQLHCVCWYLLIETCVQCKVNLYYIILFLILGEAPCYFFCLSKNRIHEYINFKRNYQNLVLFYATVFWLDFFVKELTSWLSKFQKKTIRCRTPYPIQGLSKQFSFIQYQYNIYTDFHIFIVYTILIKCSLFIEKC